MLSKDTKVKLREIIDLSLAYFPKARPKFILLNGGIATQYILIPYENNVDNPSILEMNRAKLCNEDGSIRKNYIIENVIELSIRVKCTVSDLIERGILYKNSMGIYVAGERYVTKNGIKVRLNSEIKKADPTFQLVEKKKSIFSINSKKMR